MTTPSAAQRPGPKGVRLGIDVGTVRVGVALSDPHGVLATPHGTLPRDRRTGSDLDRIVELVAEHAIVEVVVGLPKSLSGEEGPAARAARGYVRALTARLGGVPVTFSDERFTSVSANRMLADRGMSAKKSRQVVDQLAAVQILQGHLDALRAGTAATADELGPPR